MKIEYIDHINIAGPDELIESSRSFYEELLGLKVGFRPSFKSRGYWLYASERAIIHLTVSDVNRSGSTTNLDHFAFRASGLASTKSWLDSKAIEFKQERVPDLNQVQLFLTDPAGNGVELNFIGDTAS